MNLRTWRQVLGDELLTLPQEIVTRADEELQHNLSYSIRLIDHGLGCAVHHSFIDLSSLRIGELMRDAGYATKGPDLSGPKGWLGSMEEVQTRIDDANERRAKAQAALQTALTNDEGGLL